MFVESQEFSEQIAEQRRMLASVRDGQEPPPVQNVQVTGWSADRSVKAVVRGGRLSEMSVDNSVPGRPSAEIGALMAEAANSALTAYRSQAPSATDPLPDLAAIGSEFRAASEQGGQLMAMIGSALSEAIAKVGDRTGMRGDPTPHGVEYMFADAMDLLRSAQAELARLGGAQVYGEGHDEGEEIEVTVRPDGTVAIDSLSNYARKMSPQDLGEAAQEAINDALSDWEEQREDGLPSADDVDDEALLKLSDRAMALSEQSMRHLSDYTSNLSAIMRSIGEP